jgi:NIMA (never in mitosis gene a)-related kinase
MVDKEFNLKIGDFGISKVFTDNNQYAITQIGSPIYMSPEALGEDKYCHKTDIWALGCILYELVTLDYAFNARSITELYRIIKNGKFNKAKIQNQNYSFLISKMLCVDQFTRPDINYILEKIPSSNEQKKSLKKTNNKILPALIIPVNKFQWNEILPEPAYSPISKNHSEPTLKLIDNKDKDKNENVLRSKSQLDNLNPLPKINYSKNIMNKHNNHNNHNPSNNYLNNRNLPRIINHADRYLKKQNIYDQKKNPDLKNKKSYGKDYISPYNQFVLKKDINFLYNKQKNNRYVSEYKDKFKNYNNFFPKIK